MNQKTPLNLAELQKLEMAALRKGKDTDSYKVFMILRYTGMHVSVLLDRKHELHEENDEGDIMLVWQRPKKKGVWARTSILKSKRIDFDIGDFIQKVYNRRSYKRSRFYIYRLIKDLGLDAGVPGVSPQSFRHSVAVLLLDSGHSESFVCDLLNISRKTLKWYANFTDRDKKETLKKAGW